MQGTKTSRKVRFKLENHKWKCQNAGCTYSSKSWGKIIDHEMFRCDKRG